MKKAKQKLIIIAILIFLILAAGGTYLFIESRPEIMPDIIGQKKTNVLMMKDFEDYNLKFTEEYSDDIQQGFVIRTSPRAGEEITKDKILVVVSKGRDKRIELPENLKTMKIKEIEIFAKERKFFTRVEEIEDEAEEGTILKLSHDKTIKEGETLVITVSKGSKKKPEVNKKPPVVHEPEKPKMYFVPDNLLNISESDFIKAIKKVGLNPERVSYKNYSTTMKKDHIYAYDDGNFNAGATIHYILSDGPYSFDAGQYNGKTKGQVEDYVKELNNRNAHIEAIFSNVENNDKVGKVFDCSATKDGINTTVSCKLGVKKEEPVKPTPTPEPKPEAPHEHKWVEINRVDAKPGVAGYIEYKCDCGKTKKEEIPALPEEVKAYIPSQMIFDSMVYSTADEAEAFLKSNTLAKFTNVTYKKEKTRDYSVGCVYRVEVDGNASYNPGDYKVDTPITVYISMGY